MCSTYFIVDKLFIYYRMCATYCRHNDLNENDITIVSMSV